MSILTKLTLAQIKENKKRTTLTVLSISLIVSLLTAIALFLSSAWVVMRDTTVKNSGDWHFRTSIVSQEDIENLKLASFVDKITHTFSVDNIVSDQIPGKTAVFIKEFTKEVYSLGHVTHEPTIKSKFGEKRVWVARGNADESLVGKEVTFTNSRGEKMTYVVQGFLMTNQTSETIDYLVVDKDYDSPQKIALGNASTFSNYFDRFKNYTQATGVEFPVHNSRLLSLYLVTTNEVVNGLIKGIIPILVTLITLISVMVISSSFTLSLNERLKQLGALSSVGTTRMQLVKMMFSESVIVGGLGIIGGLIIGLLGTTIALHYFDQHAQVIFKLSELQTKFKLVIYWPLIVMVVVLSALIIMLAALFPALKASRRSPIDNIKQVPFKKLIQFKRRKQGNRRNVLAKLFKQPAYLAYRYKKHNSSRSKTIFLVLTISLLTFNVISNLMLQATNSVSQIANGGILNNRHTKFDITLELSNYKGDEDWMNQNQQLIDTVKTIDNIDSLRSIGKAHLHTSYKDLLYYFNQVYVARFGSEGARPIDGSGKVPIEIIYLDKKTETEFLKAANVNSEEFKDKGIIVTANVLSKEQVNAIPTNSLKGKTIIGEFTSYRSEQSVSQVNHTFEIIANVNADILPVGVSDTVTLVVSRETFSKLKTIPWLSILLKVDKTHIDNVSKQLKELRDSGKLGSIYMNNVHEQLKVMRTVLSMAQIITYGFLGLISLICLTAFYNIISTGVRLRRREFAMLQSIGMTKKQLRVMLAVENLTAGILSIIFAGAGSYVLTILGNAQGRMSIEEVIKKVDYPILPTVISSVTLLGILILFNLSTQRSALKRSLVEDIKNETL